MVALTAYVVDQSGAVVFDASDTLIWSINGPGALVGPSEYTSDLFRHQAAEGMGYTIGPTSNVVRASNQEGTIEVTVAAAGLEPATITLKSVANQLQQNLIQQAVISDEGRENVQRYEDFQEKANYREVIQPITENIPFTPNDSSREELDQLIRANNQISPRYDQAYEVLLDELSSGIQRAGGELIADDFNFSIRPFNDYAVIVRTIDNATLNLTYAQMLKEYYRERIMEQNAPLDVVEQVALIRSVPSDHVLLQVKQPEENRPEGSVKMMYVKRPAIVWSSSAEQGIYHAFPFYQQLNPKEKAQAFQRIAKLTPYVIYEPQLGEFQFEQSERYLLIPTVE